MQIFIENCKKVTKIIILDNTSYCHKISKKCT